MLLREIPVHCLKPVVSKVWNGPLDSKDPHFHIALELSNVSISLLFVFLISGLQWILIICFFFQSMLILEEPRNCPLLSEVFNSQQQRLQVIVDDLMEIEELSDVHGYFFGQLFVNIDYTSKMFIVQALS